VRAFLFDPGTTSGIGISYTLSTRCDQKFYQTEIALMSNHPQVIAQPESITNPIGWFKSFLPLTKPTITLLVVVTVIPGLLLAPELPSIGAAIAALIGTCLASASAAVFNHLLDADMDAIMNRTKKRPVASGSVSKPGAFIFGAALALVSLLILYVFTTPLAAVISLAANIFYVLIYTVCLKRYTDQNIVIGGAAGAVGPLIGYAALTGTINWPSFILFAIVFLWTPPHFWSLAIKYKDDYAEAKVPMLPVTQGLESTRKQIFWYTLTLFPAVMAIFYLGAAGWVYLVGSLLATYIFSYKAWKLLRSGDDTKAMPLFHYSCLYVFYVFGALTADRLLSFLVFS
jgi:protoheme IX farnesyltransferase